MQNKVRLGAAAAPAGICMILYAVLASVNADPIAAVIRLALIAAAVFLFMKRRSVVTPIILWVQAGGAVYTLIRSTVMNIELWGEQLTSMLPVLFLNLFVGLLLILVWFGLGLVTFRRRVAPVRGPWWLVLIALGVYLLFTAFSFISLTAALMSHDFSGDGWHLFGIGAASFASALLLVFVVIFTSIAHNTAPKEAVSEAPTAQA